MERQVLLRCECGKLRGTASGLGPSRGARVVCYCDDCQAFARFLGRPDVTDAWGGTDIFQMPPSGVRLEQEDQALQCVRLSDKGMFRWYCGFCKTPVGNTVGPRLPVVGLIHNIMDHASSNVSRDALLGRPIGFLQTRSATGGGPPPGPRASLLRTAARSSRLLLTWWVTRAGFPSPFFDERTLAPRATPRVLNERERGSV